MVIKEAVGILLSESQLVAPWLVSPLEKGVWILLPARRVEEVYWNAAVLLPVQMSEPLQASPGQQHSHAQKNCLLWDLDVRNFVLPWDAKGRPNATEEEIIHWRFSCLAYITKESLQQSSVDMAWAILSSVPMQTVTSHSVCSDLTDGGGGSGNTLVNYWGQRIERNVDETVSHLKHLTVTAVRLWFTCSTILDHDVWFLGTDCETEFAAGMRKIGLPSRCWRAMISS